MNRIEVDEQSELLIARAGLRRVRSKLLEKIGSLRRRGCKSRRVEIRAAAVARKAAYQSAMKVVERELERIDERQRKLRMQQMQLQ